MFRFEKTTVNRGDIYWIEPNPYRNNGRNHIQGKRPAVIVSNDTINARHSTYECIFLTKTPRYENPENCTIRSSKEISTALCGQISTVSKEQIGKFIGTCTMSEMETLEACMSISLGLTEPAKTEQASTLSAFEKISQSAYTMIYGEEEEEEEDEDAQYIEELEDNVKHLNEENTRLRIALEKAAHGEELLRSLYNELLTRSLDTPAKAL